MASNNLILTDTLLYLFEKTSLIYLKNSLNNKKVVTNLEDEPLEVIKKCVEFLDFYIFKPKIVASKLKEAKEKQESSKIPNELNDMFKNNDILMLPESIKK